MTVNTKILVRNAREQDLPAVAEIDAEAFPTSGTAEAPERFQRWITDFPNGFIILVADNEIAGYGYSEKWLTEREPGPNENSSKTHQPDGRIFCITSMAVKTKYRKRGYGLLILDKLMEIAHNEGCRKIVLETAHAQGLFLKRGFQTVRTRTERGTSLDIMALEIESYGGKA